MITKTYNYVICKHCKWVAFEVTRKYAKNEVSKFNEYYDTLNTKLQEELYGGNKSSIKPYERCMLCGTCYHNFRKAKKSEIPFGSTVNPIISRKD